MSGLELAVLNLLRRPTRTLLLALVVALALTTSVTLYLLAQSIQRSIAEGADERGADLSVMQKNAPDIFSGYLPDSLSARLAALPGVSGVTGELAMFAPVDGGRQMIVLGWSEGGHFWRRLTLSAGRAPTVADNRPAVIGRHVAGALGKGVGDALDIFGESFTIVGVSAAMSAFNQSIVTLRLSDLQDIALRKGQVTLFHIEADKSGSPNALRPAIEREGRYVLAQTSELLQHDRNYAVFQAVARAVTLIASVMGSLSLACAMLMSVQERRRDIGVLMAIGWGHGRIRLAFLLESALIGTLGALAAPPMIHATSLLFKHLPGLGEFVALDLTWGVLLLGQATTIALCIFGAAYPAILATRRVPMEALRSL